MNQLLRSTDKVDSDVLQKYNFIEKKFKVNDNKGWREVIAVIDSENEDSTSNVDLEVNKPNQLMKPSETKRDYRC